jgi:hypothetical protein
MATIARRERAPIPRAARIAAAVWTAVGGLTVLNLLVSLLSSGSSAGGAALALVAAIFGAGFLVVGIQTLLGKAESTLANGIGSIGLAVLFVLPLVLVAELLPSTAIGWALAVVIPAGLLLAGVLAIAGREPYRAWRAPAPAVSPPPVEPHLSEEARNAPLPRPVFLAGAIWTSFGALGIVSLVLQLTGEDLVGLSVGMRLAVAALPAFISAGFIVVGVETLLGRTKALYANGIGSIVFAVLIGGGVASAGALGSAATTLQLVSTLGLIAAGVLAIVGRTPYAEWRRVTGRARGS